MPASQRTPQECWKKILGPVGPEGNFSLARGRMSGSESVEENYEGEPNGAWRDDRGASSAPGSAAGPHRSDLPSRRPAGYGRHIWNSGGCRAEALPQVSVSKTHTWDKLRKSRRVPYYCSSLPPSVTLSAGILTPLKLVRHASFAAGKPPAQARGIVSEVHSMTHPAPICHHNCGV